MIVVICIAVIERNGDRAAGQRPGVEPTTKLGERQECVAPFEHVDLRVEDVGPDPEPLRVGVERRDTMVEEDQRGRPHPVGETTKRAARMNHVTPRAAW